MKGDKMFKEFSKFVGDNETDIIDDFCEKIKNDKVGDMTLDEYSRFRFWQVHISKELSFFHSKFVEETKDDMSYNAFCEMLWCTLDDAVPEWWDDLMGSIYACKDIKDIQIGEA